jgi:hypothetical protein
MIYSEYILGLVDSPTFLSPNAYTTLFTEKKQIWSLVPCFMDPKALANINNLESDVLNSDNADDDEIGSEVDGVQDESPTSDL